MGWLHSPGWAELFALRERAVVPFVNLVSSVQHFPGNCPCGEISAPQTGICILLPVHSSKEQSGWHSDIYKEKLLHLGITASACVSFSPPPPPTLCSSFSLPYKLNASGGCISFPQDTIGVFPLQCPKIFISDSWMPGAELRILNSTASSKQKFKAHAEEEWSAYKQSSA